MLDSIFQGTQVGGNAKRIHQQGKFDGHTSQGRENKCAYNFKGRLIQVSLESFGSSFLVSVDLGSKGSGHVG